MNEDKKVLKSKRVLISLLLIFFIYNTLLLVAIYTSINQINCEKITNIQYVEKKQEADELDEAEDDIFRQIEYTYYIVQEGDTVATIAEKFDITVDSITWANNLQNGIKIDQILAIPSVSGMLVTVKEDTEIDQISKEYDVKVETILILNYEVLESYSVTTVKTGTTLFIPDPHNKFIPG